MPVVVASALLGFCGVVYEFALAQSLSILFGNSAVQYSLTIGLFIAGMGLGSHRAEGFSGPRLSLWRAQLILSLFAPAMSLLFWWLAICGYAETARWLAYGTIVSIGFLTGLELPLLLKLRNSQTSGLILAADYFGMLTACVLFPLLLLPELGVLQTLFLTALLNSATMILIWPRRRPWHALCSTVQIALILFEPSLRQILSQKLVSG